MTKNITKGLVFTLLDCESIYSVNPLYLQVNHANGYIEEENESNYSVFDPTDENKELIKNLKMSGV